MIQDSTPPAGEQPRRGQYAVFRFGDEWRLLHAGATIGQFRSLEAANAVAAKLCRAVANVGFDVDLTVQTYAGELRNERIPNRLTSLDGAR